jgi:FdhE protein
VTTTGSASRARELARASAAAREPLEFVAQLCEAQARSSAELGARTDWSGSLALDLEHALEPLAHVGELLGEVSRDQLHAYWAGECPAQQAFLPRAFLRPYVELLRELGIRPERAHPAGCCPFCGGAPLLALRRGGGAQGEGALRSLVCGLCGLEWSIPRIRCPVCAEADPARLPIFRAAEYPAVRVEACESCRRYLKSLEVVGQSPEFPEIDELASLALDLWAEEQDFSRLEPNLAGL